MSERSIKRTQFPHSTLHPRTTPGVVNYYIVRRPGEQSVIKSEQKVIHWSIRVIRSEIIISSTKTQIPFVNNGWCWKFSHEEEYRVLCYVSEIII